MYTERRRKDRTIRPAKRRKSCTKQMVATRRRFKLRMQREKVRRGSVVRPYMVVFTIDGRERASLNPGDRQRKRFATYEGAFSRFNEAIRQSEAVRIPRRIQMYYRKPKEVVYEVLLLMMDGADNYRDNVFRDGSGKLVEHESNLEGWRVIDGRRIVVEETYWVYGYDIMVGRKDFWWVLALARECYARHRSLLMSAYSNKLLLYQPDGEVEIIIAKNVEEVMRLYNELAKELSNGEGVTLGGVTPSSTNPTLAQRKLEDIIIAKTGWSAEITRRSTMRKQV